MSDDATPAKVRLTAIDRVRELVLQAGPEGIRLAGIVDDRWTPKTIRGEVFVLSRAGLIWRVRFGIKGQPRKRFTLYFGRVEWFEAAQAQYKAIRKAAKAEFSRAAWAKIKAAKAIKPKARAPKRAKPEPKASQKCAKVAAPKAPKPLAVKQQALAASVAIRIPARPPAGFAQREAENMAEALERRHIVPTCLDHRFTVQGPVPRRIGLGTEGECRPWAEAAIRRTA